MTDLPNLPWTADRAKWQVARGIIVTGWWMTLVVMLVLILAPVYLWVMGKPVADPLLALAGVAVASLLKDFSVVIKDFVGEATK